MPDISVCKTRAARDGVDRPEETIKGSSIECQFHLVWLDFSHFANIDHLNFGMNANLL